MGRKSRMRTRRVVQNNTTLYLGDLIREKYDPVTHQWYVDRVTPQSVTFGKGNLLNRYHRLYEVCYDEVHWPGPPYKLGGPLNLIKGYDGLSSPNFLTSGGPFVDPVYGQYRYTYNGLWIPYWAPPSPYRLIQTITESSACFTELLDVSSYGPSAMAKYSPLKPRVDLGQTLAEIKDIPAMLKRTAGLFKDAYKSNKKAFMYNNRAKRVIRKTSGEYLNWQFGWLPFLGTIIDFHETTTNLSKIMLRLRDKNGQWQKRGGPVDKIEDETSIASGSLSSAATYPALISILNTGGSYTVTKQEVTEVWYSGRCKYYTPELDKPEFWPSSVLRRIYGLTITPDLLWALTPWSWMVDWTANVSNTLNNWTEHHDYNLVWDRAYLMGTSRIRFVFDAIRHCGSTRNHGQWSFDFVRKQRKTASPYGLDTPGSSLDPYRLSILSALRLNRLK